MALADPIRKLTYQDYLLFPEDGLRHEILDGEHFVTASPFVRHQAVSANLYFLVGSFVREHSLGKLYFAPLDVLLSPHDVVVPDLLFVSKERLEIITPQNIQGAPDLVVEVLSKSTRHRDQGIKLQRYSSAGVREYWILDPDLRTAQVYHQQAGRLAITSELSAEAGDTLISPLFPGLEIPLARVFE